MRRTAEAIFGELLGADVRFVLIGALAATMHGSYLRTGDIDICPDAAEDNLGRLARVLNDLQALEWDPRKDEAIERDFTEDLLAADKF